MDNKLKKSKKYFQERLFKILKQFIFRENYEKFEKKQRY